MVNVAYAIANLVESQHLKPDYIIPQINDQRILPVVSQTLNRVIQKTVTDNYDKEIMMISSEESKFFKMN